MKIWRGGLIFFSVACILFFKTLVIYSQQQHIIHHYTNENGLPANGVKGIELDKKNGFLWVATQAGLVRFDGKHFTQVGSPKNTMAASRINFIAKNREGTIYCEDDNFSVFRINSNNAEFVMTDTVFYPFYQSKRWQTLYQSVTQLKGILMDHKRSALLPNWIVFHDESGDSSSFSFSHLGHAYHYSAGEDSLFHLPGLNDVMKIGTEVYFVDSAFHLWRYNDQLRKLRQVQVKGMPEWKQKKGEMPRLIWKPGMKDPLFVWEQNIWKLQDRENELHLLPLCYSCSPANADISSAQIWEEQELIFLGSAVNGLYVVKKPFLHTIRADTTVEAGKAEYAQAELTPGIITTGSGLSFSAQGKLLPGQSRKKLHLNTLYRDRYGDHWFHSGDTIIHFHRQDGHYTKIAVNDGAERMIFAEMGDRLYVFSDIAIAEITGERYKLLYKLPYEPDERKNWLNPDAVAELSPGVLAIAAEKLMLFDIEKRKAPDTIPIPGLTVKVRALHKYGDYLLIGTYGQGFYMYKNGLIKKMPLDKNGYLNYAHCFLPDANGYCWISSNHGLFKVRFSALTAAYENDLDEIYFHYFGKEDGIYNTELNGGCQPCALQLSSGLFSFPSMNGVVIADPMQPHTPPPSGKVFIDHVLADSKSYKMTDSALQELPYQLQNLRFRIALPQFGNTENIYFSYKLEAYNKDWESQDIVQNNILQFGGLKPGAYTLHLKVRNSFEHDQFGLTTISFRILKPWFQTWWFYVLCVLAFFALTWSLVKWRTATIARRKVELQYLVTAQTKDLADQGRMLESQLQQLQHQQSKLEEDNQIKARLIGIISHDMVGPIRMMGFMAKRLIDFFSPADEGHRITKAFSNVTQELESLSVNMLNWIRFHHDSYNMKPEQFDLRTLVKESTEIAATLANEKGVQLYIDVPENLRIWQYRQALGVIVYNLSINAMKYTEKGVIRISAGNNGDTDSLIVSDTGVGMPPHHVERLNSMEQSVSNYSTGETGKFQFGYLIIKDLLQLIQSSMRVESSLNKGTQVTIQLKNIQM